MLVLWEFENVGFFDALPLFTHGDKAGLAVILISSFSQMTKC